MELYMDNFKEEFDIIILENAQNTFIISLNDLTDLIDDLGYDSVGLINIVICLEKKYSIEIPDEFLLIEYLRNYNMLKKIVQSCIIDECEKLLEEINLKSNTYILQ